MSHDDSSGVIHLDEKSGSIKIDWKDVGKQKVFEQINKRLLQISKELEGTFIINPTWSSALHNELVTVHPLGGCPMGECGKTGVVNHKGQVFFGELFYIKSIVYTFLQPSKYSGDRVFVVNQSINANANTLRYKAWQQTSLKLKDKR